VPDLIVENLRPTARQAVETGSDQALEHLANGQPFLFGDEADLFG
jgi:hypothetical protein